MENSENKKPVLPWPLFAVLPVLALFLCLLFTGVAVWDDAYIFWRYAAHALSEGRWNWNTGDAASYGITSPAWTALLMLPTQFLEAPLGLWLSSFVCGMGVLLLLWKLARNARWMLAITLLANALSLSVHFTSGMDTALALLYQLLWLWLLSRQSPAWLLGLLAGFGWWVRPEVAALLLLSLTIHFLRQRKWLAPLPGLLALAVAVSVCWWGLGSALPLPFFSKTASHADVGLKEVYAGMGIREGGLFLLAQLPILVALLLRKRDALQTLHLWLPALLLCVFYALGVTQIMGYQQRFFFHAWPLLMTAGFQAMPDPSFPRKLSNTYISFAAVVCALLVIVMGRPASLGARWAHFRLEEVYVLEGGENNWPLLRQVQQLPSDAAIATTELGLPGAWNLHRPVLDLSMLTVREQMPAQPLAAQVLAQQPDVIWLHPHYTELQDAFLSNPLFQKEFEWYPPWLMGSCQGVALRKASPHFHSLQTQAEAYLAAHP